MAGNGRPFDAYPASKRQASNTAQHLDSIMISGITLSKFLIKKGGKVNMYRYSCSVFTGNEPK